MSRPDNGLSVGESGCTGEETEQGESAETCNPPSWNRPQQWHQSRQKHFDLIIRVSWQPPIRREHLMVRMRYADSSMGREMESGS